jgi:malate dehydrogenase
MVNVAVIGAAGGIGQPLSLLLKNDLPEGSTLSLYDVVSADGVAADLSHIDRNVKIIHGTGSLPPIPNCPALQLIAQDVDVFVIVAGVPRKPGMTRQDLFQINAGICLDIVLTCGRVSPNACFCIITNPINSTVPIACQALKKLGVYNKDTLFGVSTLDVLRATKFVNEIRDPYFVNWTQVPVVGGHSDVTIVPLLSQLPGPTISNSMANKIAKRVQSAGTEVVTAKAGKGSATLSMAAAGARFTLALVSALRGDCHPVVYSYVDTGGTHPSSFYSIPVLLGRQGIQARLSIGEVSASEQHLLDEATRVVKKNIESGNSFALSKL